MWPAKAPALLGPLRGDPRFEATVCLSRQEIDSRQAFPVTFAPLSGSSTVMKPLFCRHGPVEARLCTRRRNRTLAVLAFLAASLSLLNSARAVTVYLAADNLKGSNLFGTLDVATGKFTQIAMTNPLFFALAAGPGGQIFGADANSRGLFLISPQGVTTPYGTTTAPDAFSGLAYSTPHGNFFADNLNSLTVDVYSVAIDGNSSSKIGQISGPHQGYFPTGNLSYGPGGSLYFNYSTDLVNATNSVLYTVNTSTGSLTAIGNGTGTPILSLFFDGTTLYGVDSFVTSNIGVYTINTASGVATRISTVTGLPGTNDFFIDSAAATTPTSGPAVTLANISTRALVQTNDNVMIGGFVVTGNGIKQVLLRALGPTLAKSPYNLAGILSDPVLELHGGDGALVNSNDNWQQATSAGSIPDNLKPSDPHESAILTSLAPGNYTAIVRGASNSTGIALVEVYDLDTSAGSHLENISTRCFVETGDKIMIAGVIVQGSASEKVLVRALGPTIANPPFNVPDVLADPFLDLRDGNGNPLQTNNDWKDTQQGEIENTGKQPAFDSEAAIVRTLPPGNYTAIVTGTNNTTGNALVEVYELN